MYATALTALAAYPLADDCASWASSTGKLARASECADLHFVTACLNHVWLQAPASMDAPVAVRNIMLPNGQPASVIMEQGRIKRIVAANGQVAELRWHQPAPDIRHGRGAVREGNLSVSISSASLPRPQARCLMMLGSWHHDHCCVQLAQLNSMTYVSRRMQHGAQLLPCRACSPHQAAHCARPQLQLTLTGWHPEPACLLPIPSGQPRIHEPGHISFNKTHKQTCLCGRDSQSPDARPNSMPVLPKALGRLASPRKSWQSSHSPQAFNQAALLTAPAGVRLLCSAPHAGFVSASSLHNGMLSVCGRAGSRVMVPGQRCRHCTLVCPWN